MRLFECLVLLTVVASAFAQDGTGAQIEAVNALPNVDVQLVNETIRADDNATETESADSAVDPSTAIVEAINEAVETVAASLSEDAPVTEDEAVVVEEELQEDPAPTMEIAEDEEVVDDEEVQEDPVPTMEVVEEEVLEDEETVPEEDEPMLEEVAVDTPAPEVSMEESEIKFPSPMEFNATVLSVSPPEPEPEPAPEDSGERFDAEELEEQVVNVEEEPSEPSEPTKKELKAIEKYNAATDNIMKIISERFKTRDALPLNVTEEVLEELDIEVTTVPPTTTTTTTEAPAEPAEPECSAKWEAKCETEKCKGKPKCVQKCKDKGCITKKNKKKNKNKNRKDADKNNNNNKNKKTKNKNNKNKNKKNKRQNKNRLFGTQIFRNRAGSRNRMAKALDVDVEGIEQARRAGSDGLKKGKRKGDGSRGDKGKKNKKNKPKNKSRLEPEAKLDYVPQSAEDGPLFATNEELLNSPALFLGFSKISRVGDVEVDLSGKSPKFVATVSMGPLNVLLTNPASQLQRTEITTELKARMSFTARQARTREKLKINEVVVEVSEAETVNVLRSDLELEPEVVSAAQIEVSSAIDTDRVARILHHDLEAAFKEDNILQNLEDHPSLKKA